MHTYGRSSSHRTLFSNCFKKLHYMSAGSPKYLQEIQEFDEALAHELEALKPKEGSNEKILQLSWLASAVAFAFVKHKEAVSLIPPLDFPLLICDEKWMNEYMDQTARILNICNVLTGVLCNIEQSHLLLRHACHILLDARKPLSQVCVDLLDASDTTSHQEQLKRARRSLSEWLDLQDSHEPLAQKFRVILQDMIKGLLPPQEKALAKGKGFLYALYGANATTVLVFYILSLAVSNNEEILSMVLPIPSDIVWSEPMAYLSDSAKEDVKQYPRSSLCLEDLRSLETCVKDLLHLVEHTIELKAWPLPVEDVGKMAGAANDLSLLLDEIAKGLELLGSKLNEMFKAMVSSRSSLLDKLGDLGTDDL